MDDLRSLGYTVEEAFTIDDVTVYHLGGPGLSGYLRSDDQTTIDALVDPQANRERATQAGETRQQTLRRWVREKRLPPPNPQDVT